MIAKDKMFVVAGNVDDSIKSVTPIYDITIIPNFLEFEKYVNKTPSVVNTIILTETELPFTGSNMSRLIEVLKTPFLKLTGNCIYLISEDTPKEVVTNFITDMDISNIIVYQGDLTSRFIASIISGAARIADETETEIITYRMRAAEYVVAQNVKKYEKDSDYYETDEESLSGIPKMKEPEIVVPSIDVQSNTYYVVGKPSYERTLFAFIEAQYLSLLGKTILVESDVSYHRLTDLVLKSDVLYEYIDILEFNASPISVINRIKASISKLIVIGSKTRQHYEYDFVFDILMSNLLGWVDYFVKECDFSQTPYGSYYNIVCADTVPDILECCNSLAYDVEEDKVIFIGIRTGAFTPVNVTSKEMTDIIREVLEKEHLHAEVVEATGINLKGEQITYDVFSIITRGNERQGRRV